MKEAVLLKRIAVADREWKKASATTWRTATKWRKLVDALEDGKTYLCDDCMTICSDRFCAANHVRQFPGHKHRILGG